MAILQTTVGPLVGVLGVSPDVVLVLVVSWALVRGSERGMVWGFLGGLSVDLLSGAPLGTHTLALVLVGFLAGLVRRMPFHSRLVLPLIVIIGATLTYDLVTALILRVAGWPLSLPLAITGVIVPSLITNAALMPLTFWTVLWTIFQLDRFRGELRPLF